MSILAFHTNLKVKYYTITTKKINQTIRVLFLSDLHSSYYGKNQETLLQCIEKQQPDVILLGGDIADDKRPHDNTKIVLDYISPKYPCYYVSGNHEFWSGAIASIKEMFTQYGITVLEGKNDIVSIKNQIINISGVDDPEIGKDEFLAQIQTVSNEMNPSFFTIFMSHRPEYIETYRQYNFDLILSGHAHGGQWILPGIMNGLYAPNQGFFPRYAGGLYSFDTQTFIVGRGLAKWSPTLVPRIFNPPELVVIDLIAESK